MKTLRYVGKMFKGPESLREKPQTINVSEAYHLWNHLTQRYYVLHVTNLLSSFAKDDDLKIILKLGNKTLNKHIKVLENELLTYGIPLPLRMPKQTPKTVDIELISDRQIYRRVIRGIQAFIPVHTMAFLHSTSPGIRELFMSFMIDDVKIYDKFLEYGKLKNYLVGPPIYRP